MQILKAALKTLRREGDEEEEEEEEEEEAVPIKRSVCDAMAAAGVYGVLVCSTSASLAQCVFQTNLCPFSLVYNYH